LIPEGLNIGMLRTRQLGFESLQFGEPLLRSFTALARDLAADQVIAWMRRAFVNGRDARVAQYCRGAGFLDEAHAAMHLHAQGGDLDAVSVLQPSPRESSGRHTPGGVSLGRIFRFMAKSTPRRSCSKRAIASACDS